MPSKLLEEDFQFILCKGCQKESTNLKLLTCLHTFCLNCLSKNKAIGQCPVCRTAIPQASGIPDTDNLLFSSLQARLSIYKKIVDGVDLFCDNCNKAGEFWCSECKEFLCTTCFEAHQRYLKKESHEAKKVMDIKAGSAKDFLESIKRTSNLSCSNPIHKNQPVSIYCKKCEKPLCCICALLDSQHAPFCDIRSETQHRQEELVTMSQELKQKRSSFEASYVALQNEATELEQAQQEMRNLIRQRVEQLGRLIRQEEEELLGLLDARQLQGRWELARELQHVEGVLQRMEGGEWLVEKMSLYATEQEVMDMQPFIKDSLKELQQLRPPVAGDRAQPGNFAECRAKLQALVERVMGHPEYGGPPSAVILGGNMVSTSIPAKRKKAQNVGVMTVPVKEMKLEENNNTRNQTVPQQPSCSDQPGTSCLVSRMTLIKEESLLEDVPVGNNGLNDSDSDMLCLDSCEEDSTDDELDSSLLDDPSNILDESTGKDYLGLPNMGLPISSCTLLDTRQGTLVFFDVKITKEGSIQMAVVDGEKIFPVLIQPVKYFSSLMAQNNACEVGLMKLLGHLNTVRRPVLGGFGLWSLPLPALLDALMLLNKKDEFSSVVYGFLDILPLIKEKIPKRDNYRLKNLASTYLRWHFGDCSARENACVVKYLCEFLNVDLVMKPWLIISQASLESFISLQPLLAEKLLTKPSAQTLAAHNIGLSELRSCYQHNPEKGLQKVCRLINARRHSSIKKVRNLSKVKVYFQRQEQSAESQKTPADSDFPRAIKSEENC
ncbi:PREDICTED: protein PML-like [Nipponia nippon]|nr:PREDICTED: protein PML-like [Nipponia nippon]